MKKSLVFSGIIVIILIVAVAVYLRGADVEDGWICESGQWVKHGNPAQAKPPLTGCGDGTTELRDEVIFNWSTMNEGPYRDRITYATSMDLVRWTPSKVIMATHASVPGAVVKDGTIYVYYVDVGSDGIKEQLGMVKSVDQGRTWSDPDILTIDELGERAPADPAPVLLDDGRIRLFFFDINEARVNKPANGIEPKNKIYSAISDDGVDFTMENGVRFERQGIFDPDVELFDGTWYLYGGDFAGQQVVYATSDDGLNFTEGGVAYRGGAVPDVFKKGDTYYLFTAGIGIATGTTPMSFTKTEYRFSDPNYDITADPSVVMLEDGSYLMVYKTR